MNLAMALLTSFLQASSAGFYRNSRYAVLKFLFTYSFIFILFYFFFLYVCIDFFVF